MNRLKTIRLAQLNLGGFEVLNDSKKDELSNLSWVNIFVGENNSGKSRLMRGIMKISDLQFFPENMRSEEIINLLETFKNSLESLVKPLNPNQPHNLPTDVSDNYEKLRAGTGHLALIRGQIEKLKMKRLFRENELLFPELTEIFNGFKQNTQLFISLQNGHAQQLHSQDADFFRTSLFKLATDALKILNDVIQKSGYASPDFNGFKRYYIPVLRGMRSFPSINDDIYEIRTRNDYFNDSEGNPISNIDINTGLGLYKEMQAYLLGDLDKRDFITSFQTFLSEEFFSNKPVAIIPKLGVRDIALRIGSEEEKQIYDLGDGLQSLLVITYCLYKAQQEPDKIHLIFIEEPELFIHPGLQRLLLQKMLNKEFKNCQFFFTTHSNHFLDITLDFENISIFHVLKILDETTGARSIKGKFRVENVSSGDKKTLEILGVRDSSVFLSNCTIWVEGITDRMYLRHYLMLYQAKLQAEAEARKNTFLPYKEDFHYSFLEYGGSNLSHLNFGDENTEQITIERVTKNVFVIADYDGGKEKKHSELRKVLGKDYYPLPVREIENLISSEVLKEIILKLEARKGNNDIVLGNLPYSGYKTKYLGGHIQDHVLKKGKLKYPYVSGEGSPTIRYKIPFAKVAIELTDSWEKLSPDAQVLAQKMYHFITEHNKRT